MCHFSIAKPDDGSSKRAIYRAFGVLSRRRAPFCRIGDDEKSGITVHAPNVCVSIAGSH
jgi:hypothetical protein